MNRSWRRLLGLLLCLGSVGWTQEKVIIDTDIGDDVDDAFALALAVKSPELQVLGISTAFGETEARAKIVDRFLAEVGKSNIPVFVGKPVGKTPMSQRLYGEEGHFAKSSHADATDFLRRCSTRPFTHSRLSARLVSSRSCDVKLAATISVIFRRSGRVRLCSPGAWRSSSYPWLACRRSLDFSESSTCLASRYAPVPTMACSGLLCWRCLAVSSRSIITSSYSK